MNKANLYLIPCSLSDDYVIDQIPLSTLAIIKTIKYFIVEREKSARKFLKHCQSQFEQSDFVFLEIDKHNTEQSYTSFLQYCLQGNDVGLISESGVPAVADPGARVVEQAHQLHIRVVPMVGPSSILLALMASGLNGQQFCFNGYLPKDKAALQQKIKALEKESQIKNQTQIFIETNYRNEQTFQAMLQSLQPSTKLCVATNITLPHEKIRTLTVAEWKKTSIKLQDQYCVFCFLAP